MTAVALCVVVATAAGVAGTAAATTPSDDDGEYAAVQGEECTTIEPIGNGTQTVEEFYDYRTPNTTPSDSTFSSHGTTHLQADDTSTVFLYEGSDGLSLVLVHDQFEGDSAGGAVTMELDGLPAEGEWVVEDDNYSDEIGGGPYDEFDHGETSSEITWTWADNRTDGAAFNGGLDDEFAIDVDPAFNDAAEFHEYTGEVTDWEVVSATEDGHERTALDMDESLTIQSGSCVSIGVTDVSTAGTVTAGEPTEVEATVENDGAFAETIDVAITVGDQQIEEEEVSLEPGESTTVTSEVEFAETGSYTVEAGDATTDVEVESAESDDAGAEDELPGFGIGVTAIAAILALLIAKRRA